jgi:hypothetical protein
MASRLSRLLIPTLILAVGPIWAEDAPPAGGHQGHDRGAQILAKADKDGDGAISKVELKAALTEAIAKMREHMGDKAPAALTPADLDALVEKLFKAADANNDGKLTEDEIKAAGKALGESLKAMREPPKDVPIKP